MLKTSDEKKQGRMGSDPFQDLAWIQKSAKKETPKETLKETPKETPKEVEKVKVPEKPIEAAEPLPPAKPDAEEMPLKAAKVAKTKKSSEVSKTTKNSTKEKVVEERKNTSKAGLKEGWTRAAFIMREEWVEKVKDYAYWERLEVKETMDLAMEEFFENKKVRARPKKKR